MQEARIAPGPQHLRALERANAVRLARAELKRRVAEGDVSAADVVLEARWEAESMTVSELLTSQRRWGSTRCRKFLALVPLPENKTVGSMTDRQRPLAQLLRDGERICRSESAEEDAERLAPALAGVA